MGANFTKVKMITFIWLFLNAGYTANAGGV
jgi:hypothetical protein